MLHLFLCYNKIIEKSKHKKLNTTRKKLLKTKVEKESITIKSINRNMFFPFLKSIFSFIITDDSFS